MNYPSKNDVNKVRTIFRVLAAIILLCGLLAGVNVMLAVVMESFEPAVWAGLAVVAIMSHVSGSVAFTGYAPKYLLFAHGSKQNT